MKYKWRGIFYPNKIKVKLESTIKEFVPSLMIKEVDIRILRENINNFFNVMHYLDLLQNTPKFSVY